MESLGDTIAGGLGGLACVLAGQPLDTIKVKLQTYPHLYKSLYDSLSRTYLEEGLRGFYAGSASAIVSNVGENAVLFVCYGHCQRVVQWLAGIQNQSDLTVFQRASAGSLASVISSIAITPPDRVKCKMQVQRQALQDMRGLPQPGQLVHEGAWRVTRRIISEEGPLGLFRGLTSTCARGVPGYFFFFGGYDASRKLLTPQGQSYEDLSIWRLTVAGGIAGCCSWGAVFPTDVVKSRIQVKGELSSSFWVTMVEILRNEGVLALYKGLLPTFVRSFPANGALFITYEYTRLLFAQPSSSSLTE